MDFGLFFAVAGLGLLAAGLTAHLPSREDRRLLFTGLVIAGVILLEAMLATRLGIDWRESCRAVSAIWGAAALLLLAAWGLWQIARCRPSGGSGSD